MSIRFGLGVIAVGLLSSTPVLAQLDIGTYKIKSPSGVVIGHVSVSGDSPGADLDAYEEAWEWDNTSWPDADFYLDPGELGADVAKSILYDNLAFDDGVTEAPPTSLGSNERLYRAELCGSGGVCDVAAYVLVELTDYNLEWFKAPGLGSYDRIPLTSNRTLRFYVLSTPPSSSGPVPHLDNPAL